MSSNTNFASAPAFTIETPVPISIICPGCNNRLTTADSAAGKNVKCMKCQTLMTIAGASEFDGMDDTPAEKPASPPKSKEDDVETRPRKMRKKDAVAGAAMTRNIVVGIALLIFVCIGVLIWTNRTKHRDETGKADPARQGQHPESGPIQPVDPDPIAMPKPATPTVDPYDMDWQTWGVGVDFKTLHVKGQEAIAALDKRGVKVYGSIHAMYSASIPRELITPEGRLPSEILKDLRTAGVQIITLEGLSDAGVVDLAQLRCLQVVTLQGESSFIDAGLAGFAPLKSLKGLSLIGPAKGKPLAVTGDGFKHLTSLPNLDFLIVRNAMVDDAGLARLAGQTTLAGLHLENNKITDGGLIHLRRLSKLAYLTLDSNPITGTGFTDTPALLALESLSLNHCPVSDTGLKAIAGLNAKKVLLYDSKVTDAGVPAVLKMRSLHQFRLEKSPVTDACLKTLATHPTLEELEIRETKITGEGIQVLATAPNLKKVLVTKGRAMTQDDADRLKRANPWLGVVLYN